MSTLPQQFENMGATLKNEKNTLSY